MNFLHRLKLKLNPNYILFLANEQLQEFKKYIFTLCMY